MTSHLYTVHSAVIRTGVNCVKSPPWDSILDICQEFASIIGSVFAGQKRLIAVIHLPFRGSVVSLDLSDSKSTSLFCAVSVGFGIGTYVLYRLYCRYIQPFFKKPPEARKFEEDSAKPQTADKSTETNHADHKSKMGNSGSVRDPLPVYYNCQDGVTIGKQGASPSIPLNTSRPRYHRRRKRRSSDDRHRHSWRVSNSSISSDEEGEIRASFESGSLRGNLSLKSLNDRNFRLSQIGVNIPSSGISQSCPVSPENNKREHPFDFINKKFDLARSSSKNVRVSQSSEEQSETGYHAKLNANCTSLLTPPSEDEHVFSSRSHDIASSLSGLNNDGSLLALSESKEKESLTVFPTPSTGGHTSASDIEEVPSKGGNVLLQSSRRSSQEQQHSNEETLISADDYVNGFSGVEDSELGHLGENGPEEALLRKHNLNKRLQDFTAGPDSSCNSVDSTPDLSPFHRALLSKNSDKSADYFSDFGTSDSELFNQLDSVNSISGLEEFSEIEHTIPSVENELAEINTQISLLMTKSGTGSDLTDEGVADQPTMTSSQELAQRACDMVEQKHFGVSRKLSRASSQSDSSLSPLHALHSTETGELSWEYDSEPIKSHLTYNPGEVIIRGKGVNVAGPVGGELEFSDTGSIKDSYLSHLPGYSHDMDPTSCEDLETDSCTDGVLEEGLSPIHVGIPVVRRGLAIQVHEPVGLQEYGNREWKGDTPAAKKYKQAYEELLSTTPYKNIRCIRGDNYCAIRATLYQFLCSGLALPKKWTCLDNLLPCLDKLLHHPNSGLLQWSFANRLPLTKDEEQKSVMVHCLKFLIQKCVESKSISDPHERILWTTRLLNFDPICDIKLMEAVKLLMFINAAELYDAYVNECDVPIFVWLMFARDTSTNPKSFLKNHLNCVGDSGGLEQVEMCLLADTLGIRLQVFRLQYVGQPDFISHYPDDANADSPTLTLVAEDDRHYNVPTH